MTCSNSSLTNNDSLTSYTIEQATLAEVKALACLFNDYRVFYHQQSDPELALRFISERLKNNESIIFFAKDRNTNGMLGFVQLYNGFSSVGAYKFIIFNDLFIESNSRKIGIANALIAQSEKYAQTVAATKITLETGLNNIAAQNLYKKAGYIQKPLRDGDEYFIFEKKL